MIHGLLGLLGLVAQRVCCNSRMCMGARAKELQPTL